jgi:ELWxxDGT repeat protein
MVKDIRPGHAWSKPKKLTAVGDQLFFGAKDGLHGQELWVSDGLETGTKMVEDLRPGNSGSKPHFYGGIDGKALFNAQSDEGVKLYVSDGSSVEVLAEDNLDR